MEKKIITDLDIDNLMSDWLERDGDTFAHIRKEGALDWDRKIGDSDSLSDYFLPSDITKLEVIKKAYSIASDFINVMNPPFKVKIKVSNTPDSWTDSRKLQVSSKIFDDETVALGEQIDIFCGLAIHEGCHLLYTDFNCLRAISNRTVHNIVNFIEDERIETLCGDKTPGLAKFLAKSKFYYFDQYYLDEIASHKDKMDKLSDLEKILNLLLMIIRYPKYLEEEQIVKYARLLIEIKKVLLPFPKSTKEVIKVAKKIYEIIVAIYKEKAKDKREMSARIEATESKKRERESERERRKEKEARDFMEKGIIPKDHSEEDKKEDEADTKELDEKFGDIRKEERSLEELIDAAMDKLSDKADGSDESTYDIDSATGETLISIDTDSFERKTRAHKISTKPEDTSIDMSDEIKARRGLTAKEVEGIITTGSSKNIIFENQKENKEVYKDSYRRICRYIPSISKILKGHCRDYKLTMRSMRSGVLDTNKLAEAKQGVPTVYLRNGEVYTDKISAVVLIDESGSMSRDRRIVSARDTAVLINEALKNIPDVELFIYGHSADQYDLGTVEIQIYKDKNYNKRYSLGSIVARSENRDGDAILEVAKTVRKQTTNNVVMFVLSDGTPAAGDYYGSAAIEDTRKKVLLAEKLGFYIVQVCINPEYDPSTMFKHFIILDNMATLASDLGKVLKKAIMDGAKVHTKY